MNEITFEVSALPRFVRAGAMLATFHSAAEMAARGDLGVAQMHALAGLVANPRVKEHLADGEELLVGQAAELDYDDYVSLLANWERVADEDGAHHDTERTHRNRKASGSIVGDQFFLDAVCGLAQGLQMKEILEAFAKSEWMADWDAGVALHGDAMARPFDGPHRPTMPHGRPTRDLPQSRRLTNRRHRVRVHHQPHRRADRVRTPPRKGDGRHTGTVGPERPAQPCRVTTIAVVPR